MLKEHEARSKTTEICRKHGISEATFYNHKAKYGDMEVSDAWRLKALEEEYAKLKRLLAEQMLDNAVLKDLASKMATPVARRWAVAHAMHAHRVSGGHAPF